MGLLKKKKEESTTELPKLPSLPELPSLPAFDSSDKKELHELPSFPGSEIGEKFSQNNIKDAVSGREEEENDGLENMPKFPETNPKINPTQPPKTQELMKEHEIEKLIPQKLVSQEPVFVQIDKFEEGLDVFKKMKKNIGEIEELLQETKNLKQKEEQELSLWEAEIQKMKDEIHRVDQDIFSRI